MACIRSNSSGCQKDDLLSEIEIGSEFGVEILREGQFSRFEVTENQAKKIFVNKNWFKTRERHNDKMGQQFRKQY